MPNYGLIGKLSSAPENREALVNLLTQAADLMRKIASCHSYIVTKDADDPGAVWVIELWDSKEAHDDSLTAPEVRQLIGQAMPLLKGNPEGITLIPVSGKGL